MYTFHAARRRSRTSLLWIGQTSRRPTKNARRGHDWSALPPHPDCVRVPMVLCNASYYGTVAAIRSSPRAGLPAVAVAPAAEHRATLPLSQNHTSALRLSTSAYWPDWLLALGRDGTLSAIYKRCRFLCACRSTGRAELRFRSLSTKPRNNDVHSRQGIASEASVENAHHCFEVWLIKIESGAQLFPSIGKRKGNGIACSVNCPTNPVTAQRQKPVRPIGGVERRRAEV